MPTSTGGPTLFFSNRLGCGCSLLLSLAITGLSLLIFRSRRRSGGTGWKTSLFPKDGRYIVPVKAWVRKAEGLEVGDMVTVCLTVDV
jgi:Domain of unknown function (DUF1905)